MLSAIGTRLKAIRKEKGITLQELSKKTDLSIGLLSNVERNLRSPTIINFHKICNALDITVTEVLDSPVEKLYVKKEEREIAFSKKTHDTDLVYTVMTSGEKEIKGMCMIINDNIVHKSYKHTSDELGIIISGELDFEVEGEKYHLKEGDTIYVPASSNHSFRKTNKGTCESYWITTTSETAKQCASE